jgi:hypothetical protein
MRDMTKKAGSGSIAFTTKGGKEIAFKAKGSNAKRRQVHVKQMEKRLSAIEKAVMQYNHAVTTPTAKKGVSKEEPEKVKKTIQTVLRGGKGKKDVAKKGE